MCTGPRKLARVAGLGLLAASTACAGTLPSELRALKSRLERHARRLASHFAPTRRAAPPPWAQRADPPLATVAVLADPHYDDSGALAWAMPARARLLTVARYLNRAIKPDAVVVLGDIIANEHDPQQLRNVKKLLDTHLHAPCLPVPGNHDGPAYETVFGPRNYTRTVGGLRFVILGIRYWHWDSGWGTYERLDWLARQLAGRGAQPTLILTHNPICLPTFANAGEVCRVVHAHPQVLAVLAGHMHTDYEFPLARPHLGMPMLVRPPYAFKVLRVHPDRILVFTHEEQRGAYGRANIYQKIDVPAACRIRPTPPRQRLPGEG